MIFRKRSVQEAIIASKEDDSRQLKPNSLNWYHLSLMAVGISVGAGIFSIGAKTIATTAGPATIISFLIAALICGLATLCYAELASKLPIAGSSYTYSYTSLGEIVAWIIGWDLILEYFLASSLVAKVWGIYFTGLIQDITNNPSFTTSISFGFIDVDLAPFFLVLAITIILIRGTKMSAILNNVFVAIKVGIILFIIVCGIQFFNLNNLSPFIPQSVPKVQSERNPIHQNLLSVILGSSGTNFGIWGIFTGASVVIFAFLGFEGVASSAEETKNPSKNVPKGMIVGLGIITVLYVSITVVLSGMMSMSDWNIIDKQGQDFSLSSAFNFHGISWASNIINIGAILGLTSVVIVAFFSVTRVSFAMSRDGLLPKWLSDTSKSKKQIPTRLIVIFGVTMMFLSSSINILDLEEMVNIGTLSAFIIVAFSIPILRRREKKEGIFYDTDKFKVPLNPVLPIVIGLLCIWLALNLTVFTWIRFIIWLIVGLTIYFTYSYKHSKLNK